MTDELLDCLRPDAVLGDLPTHRCEVTPQVSGEEVADKFKRYPDLPGVLIVEGARLKGMISREVLLEHLSRPFGLEIYMNRPIAVLAQALDFQPLSLGADTGVHEAAHIALTRPRHCVYEPVVVELPDSQYAVLSSHVLLLAQSRLLAIANETSRREKEAADAANRAKSQFLANMSHEIRTPMNGIIGLTSLVLESELTGQQREYLDMVRNSAEWLVTIINDVLDFSKIEAGKLDVVSETFDFHQLFDELMKPLRFRAHSKHLDFDYALQPDVPRFLTGDSVRLRQVFFNLVGNAIKFTESGSVEVHVELDSAEDGEEIVWLRCRVRDTGVGISRDQIEKIFVEFEQADGSTSRRFGGTGLGLSISARLVELMHGRLWAESELGKGSSFLFVVRLKRAESPDAAMSQVVDNQLRGQQSVTPAEFHRQGRRVLLAEDNLVNQTLAVALLHKSGMDVTVANNGREALNALANSSFDLVLMDSQMPVLDGLETTRRIRERERKTGSRHLPIVAMTAHALKGDRERYLASGMDGYVSKPINPVDLFREIDRVLADCFASTSPAEQPSGVGLANDESKNLSNLTHDWQAALVHTGGDERLLRDVVRAFLSDWRNLVSDASQAAEAGDAERLQRASHSLKGACGYLAANEARSIAEYVEELARKCRCIEASASLRQLNAEFERLEPILLEFAEGMSAHATSPAATDRTSVAIS